MAACGNRREPELVVCQYSVNVPEAGQVVGGKSWDGCCHFSSMSGGKSKCQLRCGQGTSETSPCCQLHLAAELQPPLQRWLKDLHRSLEVGRDPGTGHAWLRRKKGARSLCKTEGGGYWRHKAEAASVATRGLSGLWVALLVRCQQARTHPMQRCLKPQCT